MGTEDIAQNIIHVNHGVIACPRRIVFDTREGANGVNRRVYPVYCARTPKAWGYREWQGLEINGVIRDLRHIQELSKNVGRN